MLPSAGALHKPVFPETAIRGANAMEIEQSFTVPASPATVYDALVDLERVGPCIPGATVGPAGEDGAHPARIAIRLGPMRMTYEGTVRIVERDEPARRAVLSADVREARGQGTARARMEMRVAQDGAGATVTSTTAVDLTGRAAQMGRGIIDDVAARLVGDMAANLAAMLLAEPPAEPAAEPEPPPAPTLRGGSLLLRALWDRIARLFRRS